MPRLAWLTDLHLDAATPEQIEALEDEVCAAAPDAVLIGGDTAQALAYADALRDLAKRFAAPVYFVLGNHDYYHGSIAATREAARELSRSGENVTWLVDAGVVPLGRETALLGHGGWGDGRLGDFAGSSVVLNDYWFIDDLRLAAAAEGDLEQRVEEGLGLPDSLRERLNALGDDAAAHIRETLTRVPEGRTHLIVLTHVPPWREACWYEGETSDDNWAPHFTCAAVGDVLREHMERHPELRMTVLCGHTHHAGEADILPNLHVLTAAAEYGNPRLAKVISVR